MKRRLELFDLNIHNYPRSSNVYDLMGDCLLAKQDSTQALKNFHKVLQVGKNVFYQEKKDMQKRTLETELYFFLKLYVVVKVLKKIWVRTPCRNS